MPLKNIQKSVIELQLKNFQAAIDAVPIGESKGLPPTINRDDARIFAQMFGTDAALDRAGEMLSLDQPGAQAFLIAANDLLKFFPDGKTTSIDIADSQENMDFGILFAWVLQGLLALEKKNRILYRQPIQLLNGPPMAHVFTLWVSGVLIVLMFAFSAMVLVTFWEFKKPIFKGVSEDEKERFRLYFVEGALLLFWLVCTPPLRGSDLLVAKQINSNISISP